MDNLLDEMDEFLTEIINQQWSKNQSSTKDATNGNVPIVKKEQTIFPRSRLQPLTLGEINEWAISLRSNVRK